jgi:probable HAF family extracellular repeat protein
MDLRRLASAGIVLYLLGSSGSLRAAAPSFTPLGSAPSYAYGVSADGSVVVGTLGTFFAFRWTAAGGLQPVTLPIGYSAGDGRGISADGSVVVGGWRGPIGAEAFRQSGVGGAQGLGSMGGGFQTTTAFGASADGSVVVGKGTNAAGFEQPFRWTASAGAEGLGILAGFTDGTATAASADGSVVIGSSLTITSSPTSRAFRWTAASGIVGLGPSNVRSGAIDISDDGTAIVGFQGTRATRWTAGGNTDLGSLPSFESFAANGVSADGSVIVGEASAINPTSRSAPFIWDQANGMRSLTQVLADLGVQVPAGWELQSANAISADGLTIAGTGADPAGKFEGWVAVVPEPVALPLLAAAFGMFALRRRVAAP